MSLEIVIAKCLDLKGRSIVLIQQGGSFLVAEDRLHHKECKHDKGFTLKKVESDLYGYTCNCGCGYISSFSPDQYPDGVVYRKHGPSSDDKALPPIDYKAGEL